MCQVMQVSRSGYHAWLKRPESNRKAQKRELLKKIRIAIVINYNRIHRITGLTEQNYLVYRIH